MKLIDILCIIVIVAILLGLCFMSYDRIQTTNFYKTINEWELSPADSFLVWSGDLELDACIVTYYDIVLSVDSFKVYFNQDSGKIVLINTNTDDTIFKYIKEQK